ncbi:hypothetical protein MHYP_G00291900 [Metynnis hypsauchen]
MTPHDAHVITSVFSQSLLAVRPSHSNQDQLFKYYICGGQHYVSRILVAPGLPLVNSTPETGPGMGAAM